MLLGIGPFAGTVPCGRIVNRPGCTVNETAENVGREYLTVAAASAIS